MVSTVRLHILACVWGLVLTRLYGLTRANRQTAKSNFVATANGVRKGVTRMTIKTSMPVAIAA